MVFGFLAVACTFTIFGTIRQYEIDACGTMASSAARCNEGQCTHFLPPNAASMVDDRKNTSLLTRLHQANTSFG